MSHEHEHTEVEAPAVRPAAGGGEAPPVHPAAHLVRLALVVLLGVAGFLVVRSEVVPDSFGRDGYYRGTAVDEIVAREPRYMGAQTCSECHRERADTHAGAGHRTVPCETCHGPAAGHLTTIDESRTHLEVNRSQDLCLGCHAHLVGRPATFPQIDLAEHVGEGETCLDCHDPHAPL